MDLTSEQARSPSIVDTGDPSDQDPIPIQLPHVDLRAIFVVKAIGHALLALQLVIIRLFVTVDSSYSRILIPIGIQVALSSAIALGRGPQPPPLLAASLFIDIVMVSALVHIGGGTEVIAGPTLYVLISGLAAVLLSARAALVSAAASILAYGLVIWAEHEGYLPHNATYARPPEVQARIVAFVAIGVLLPALLVSFAVLQLRTAFEQAHRESLGALRELSSRLSVPLQKILRLVADVLRSGEEVSHDAVTRMMAFAQEASDMTRNILDLAKIERNAATPHILPMDSTGLLHVTQDHYEPLARMAEVDIETRVDPSVRSIRGDRELLLRALANLTANAIRFTPSGGTVTLSVAAKGDEVHVEVHDGGRKFDPAELQRCREKPHWSAERREHTHLGLYLVHRLADAMGGRLEVRSGDHGGNVFTIALPLEPVVRPADQPGAKSVDLRALPESDLRAIHGGKAVLFGVLIAVFWWLRSSLDPTLAAGTLSALLGVSLILAAAVSLWRSTVPAWLITACVLSDMVCVLVGTHAMGGIEVVAGPMFLAAIIGIAGMVLSERSALAVAILCIAGYAGLVAAEHAELLPHHAPNLRSPERQFIAALLVSASLGATGLAVAYAGRQLRSSFRGAEALRIEAVNGLSHDLKNPLHIVLGYANLLESAEPEERNEYLDAVRDAAERALALVEGGLDVSRWQSGAPPAPKLEPVRVNDLAKQTAGRFRLAAAERQLRLVTTLAPDLPEVHADPNLLERALANLISNAIKYGGRNGVVEVSTASSDGRLAIAVRDQGAGMTPAEQAQLFRQFSRTDSGLGIEGTGLGLYIVRTIAEAHGGAVRVDSKRGSGSTFTLELPIQ